MRILMFLLILEWCFRPFASALPDAPELTAVSVDPATGQVTITWQPSTSPNIMQYEFYEIIAGIDGGVPFITLPRTETSYTFTSVDNRSRTFYLLARDSNYIASDETPMHNTLSTQIQFDSCNNRLILSWNAYIGWPGGVLHYEIYDYSTSLMLGTTTATSYVIPNISANTTYTFYVKAESGTAATSTSYRVSKYTSMPSSPSYIRGTATVEGTSIITDFTIDPASELNQYILYRSLSVSRDFEAIKTFSGYSGKQLRFSDPDRNTSSVTYYYKLAALNTCNTEIKVSGPVNNIVLQASNSELTNHLEWTRYKPLSDELRYTVVQVNNEHAKNIAENTSALQYDDDLSSLRRYTGDGRMENEFCYYVTVNDSTGTARSNQVCVSVQPDLKIPNGFTPNGDGKNDVFMPLISFTPEKYLLVIYNRWGNKLFQSNRPEDGWDGRYKGKPVETGVYVYSLLITAADGRETIKNGEITVVYP